MSSDLHQRHEPERLTAAHRDETTHHAADAIFEAIARTAATLCEATGAAVAVIGADQTRLVGAYGPDRHLLTDALPQLLAAAAAGEHVITDVATDTRTRDHQPVHGESRLRFRAAAPILSSQGQHLGVIAAIDQSPRQLTEAQATTLAHLADLTAYLLDRQPATQHTTPAPGDHRAEQAAPVLANRLRDAAIAQRDATPPATCQLGGTTTPCRAPAEFKVADSWGDSAWGCTAHVHQALLPFRSLFPAPEELGGLADFLARP